MSEGKYQAIRAKTKYLFDFNVKLTERQHENSVSNSKEIEQGVHRLNSCPKRLVFELTNVCNLRCRMCGRNDADFATTMFDTKWIDKFESVLNTVEEVTLMGWGEPTMHPEFTEILERLNQYAVRKYFCTNGQRLAEQKLFNALFDHKVDIMAVSLDGAVAATNNSIRGKGFDNVVRNLKNIVQERIKRQTAFPYINFVFTAMRSNIHEIHDLVRLASEIGIEEVKVVFLTAFNSAMEAEVLHNQIYEVKQIFNEAVDVAAELNIRIKLPYVQGEDPSGLSNHKPCYTAWRDLFIGSDGFIRPCMSTPIKFFHIDECNDFNAMWNHPSYLLFRKIINNAEVEPDSCKHCYQSSFANCNRDHAFIQTGLNFSPEWRKRTDIPVVNKIRTYNSIYFDIVGTCNAKCRFCVTGVSGHPKGGIIEVDKFQRAIDILFENKLIDCNTVIELFNWGEPTLHPDLGKIIDILQKKSLMYSMSTNAGRYIQYQPEWFKNMKVMLVSMCGFSQESYDRIHQFNFEEVKTNITSIVNVAEKAGYDTSKIVLLQHIYQFNTHEVPLLHEFSAKLRVNFNPYYAYINDPMKLQKYIDNTLEPQEWKEISQNIFGHFIQKRLDLHPKNQCRQFDILNLDEKGNILPCCCLPRDHVDYVLTNIFDENFMEVLGKWQPTETCIKCMKAGMSPLTTLSDSFSFTVPSELSFVEVIYLVAKKIKRRLKMIQHEVKKYFIYKIS